MRFNPLRSIYRIRNWWAELIFDVMAGVCDVRWGEFVSLVLAHVRFQHNSRASVARMSEHCSSYWPKSHVDSVSIRAY